ncbi:hypothetical protein XELAEV_18037763mg [Xenopus laevis]|uniref:Uncharacterized protein n=1 Tax=Xenopus laevis TaxID=8355 RepID=A0A974CCQ5_XENLA|nr:hypothetical protein XELAEV_18037763mg [Xenopus laevis]
MQVTYPTWILALLCLLATQVTAFPSEMQSDDSNTLQDILDQYIKPYVEPVMDRVKDSPLYTSFRNVMDNVDYVTKQTKYTLAMLSAAYFWGPMDRLNQKTKPLQEFVYNLLWEKNEQ